MRHRRETCCKGNVDGSSDSVNVNKRSSGISSVATDSRVCRYSKSESNKQRYRAGAVIDNHCRMFYSRVELLGYVLEDRARACSSFKTLADVGWAWPWSLSFPNVSSNNGCAEQTKHFPNHNHKRHTMGLSFYSILGIILRVSYIHFSITGSSSAHSNACPLFVGKICLLWISNHVSAPRPNNRTTRCLLP